MLKIDKVYINSLKYLKLMNVFKNKYYETFKEDEKEIEILYKMACKYGYKIDRDCNELLNILLKCLKKF